MKEFICASAKSIAKAIRDKSVSSYEVVEACIRQIETINPKINAVVQLDAQRALDQAKKADEELSKGQVRGTLHGVPMTIKDNLDTAGMITTGGTTGRAGFVPDTDATVVSRLRSAGAILVGKTNTPELTLAYETDNLIYGRTSNPYDLERTSGGSSGGAAAVLAAGGIPFDIGSDTGGSIRLPSHACGTAGIRPTSGRVPRTGHILPPGGVMDFLTQIGPMSRHVEDLAVILPIIAGVDWKDPSIIPMPMRSPDHVDLSKLRVAFHTDNGIAAPTPEIQSAVRSAAESLGDVVAQVAEKCPAGIEQALELNTELTIGDGGAWIRHLLDDFGTTAVHPWIQGILDIAEDHPLPLPEFSHLFLRLDRFRSRMLSFMASFDALICPVNATPALPHGQSIENYPNFSYTFTYNLTGWPGAVVRVGESAEGLPIGVQIVARPWREDVALKIAEYLETVFGGWQQPDML